MATTVTKVIDPDSGPGYDYASLFDWEVAQQGDLTGARDEIAVAKCRCTAGTADTTAVAIDGWITSATQYIKIWTDTSEAYRHNGTYQTGNKYRLELTSGSNSIYEDYTKLIGLQISISGSEQKAIASFGGNYILISHCIIKGDGSTTFAFHNEYATTGNIAYIYNCIFYSHYRAVHNWADRTLYLYSCTIVNNSSQGVYNGGTAYCKDVLCDNPAGGDDRDFSSPTGTMVCTNCASSGITADDFGGSGNRVSQTFSFVGAADFHLQASDTGALGYGLNLYNDANYPFQDDIDGQDRGGSGKIWDIGADQYNPIVLYYRTAATPTALSAASWTAYTVPFTSLGYVQVKAEA